MLIIGDVITIPVGNRVVGWIRRLGRPESRSWSTVQPIPPNRGGACSGHVFVELPGSQPKPVGINVNQGAAIGPAVSGTIRVAAATNSARKVLKSSPWARHFLQARFWETPPRARHRFT